MPAAPGCMIFLSKRLLQILRASTRSASVHSTSPRTALRYLPGATLFAMVWNTSWLAHWSFAPCTKQVLPRAVTFEQTSSHSWRVLGGCTPACCSSVLLTRSVPAAPEPTGRATSLSPWVKAVTPWVASSSCQSLPSDCSAAGFRSTPKRPYCPVSAPGWSANTSGPLVEATPVRSEDG